ncbi:MAG: aldehyde dehydrogenase family protein, partial [Planctomycetota bacterium]|nr:aldehyde dehydrogenase family protein [Planctomycetota bacterium]
MSKGNWIAGQWEQGSGGALESFSTLTGEIIWRGRSASPVEVDRAFVAARKAFQAWSELTVEERFVFARKFQTVVTEHADAFAKVISEEMGKPLWEAKTEVSAVAGKVDLAIDALRMRRDTTVADISGVRAVTRYRPHGVMGVLGPFNLPAHLPNGHIVPAILAGNTVVFKPSELTPLVAEWMMQFWEKAEIPPGVINLVQGERGTGTAITGHSELDGLLFTGSSQAGIAINQSLAGDPQKIVALEMGGNNPLVLHHCQDLKAAAYQTILSAYITSGQRCTCARRLILVDGDESRQFIDELTNFISKIKIGYFDEEPEPFYGPVV